MLDPKPFKVGGHHQYLSEVIYAAMKAVGAKDLGLNYCAFSTDSLDYLEEWVHTNVQMADPYQIVPFEPRTALAGMGYFEMYGHEKDLEKPGQSLFSCLAKNDKDVVYVGRSCFSRIDSSIVDKESFFIAKDAKAVSRFFAAYKFAEKVIRRSTFHIFDKYGSEIEDEIRPASWEDIFLSNQVGSRIREEIDTFFLPSTQDAFRKRGIDWRRGMLFYGPPGNGKTITCRAIMTTRKFPIIHYEVKGDKYHEDLEYLATTIRKTAPCVVIIEDIDSLILNDGLRAHTLGIFDGATSSNGTFTLATTNSPDSLDDAFTGRPSRFDECIFFGNPNSAERKSILSAINKGNGTIDPDNISGLVKESDGLSAACIKEIVTCSLMASLKANRSVEFEDMVDALKKVRKHMAVSRKNLSCKSEAGFGKIGFDRSENR